MIGFFFMIKFKLNKLALILIVYIYSIQNNYKFLKIMSKIENYK